MLNSRGQAFDAFKLLIAAVVAGAILVILLSMIGGFTAVGSEPDQVMAQELNKVKRGGIASTSSSVVKFPEGNYYEADAIALQAGLNKGSVKFCCTYSGDSSDKCKNYEFDDEFFDCDEDVINEVTQTVSGKIRAYCPPNSGDCVIGFKSAR